MQNFQKRLTTILVFGFAAVSNCNPVMASQTSVIWSSVLAKGVTGSALYDSANENRKANLQTNKVAISKKCKGSNKANRALIGAAIGGFMGNRMSRNKPLGTLTGAAAGAALASTTEDSCD